MKVVVGQRGQDDRYLAARSLAATGGLVRLVVDWYPGVGRGATAWLGRVPLRAVRELLDAGDAGEAAPLIQNLNAWAYPWQRQLARARRQGRLHGELFRYEAAFGERLAGMRHPRHDIFLGQSCAALEIFQAERKRSARPVLNQQHSGPERRRIAREEEARFPDYVRRRTRVHDAYLQRVKHEWSIAHGILVPSSEIGDALVRHGADASKLAVIPPATVLPPGITPLAAPPPGEGRVRLLCPGPVSLAGGLAYLVEAARRLTPLPLTITVVGAPEIRRSAMAAAPPNMEWVGWKSARELAQLIKRSHALVMPSLVDGCMLTQLAAMAVGRPAIVTPACGNVVEDGVTGWTVPPGDSEALAEAMRGVAESPGLAAQMADACVVAARKRDLASHSALLSTTLEQWM